MNARMEEIWRDIAMIAISRSTWHHLFKDIKNNIICIEQQTAITERKFCFGIKQFTEFQTDEIGMAIVSKKLLKKLIHLDKDKLNGKYLLWWWPDSKNDCIKDDKKSLILPCLTTHCEKM